MLSLRALLLPEEGALVEAAIEAAVRVAVENATDDNIAPDPRYGTTIALCRIGRRVLSVAWIVRPRGGCYPVHAHWAGRRERDSLNE